MHHLWTLNVMTCKFTERLQFFRMHETAKLQAYGRDLDNIRDENDVSHPALQGPFGFLTVIWRAHGQSDTPLS